MSDEPERPAVDLGKTSDAASGQTSGGAAGDAPADFDPYRFGKPDHPVPPEYAPPGYRPDPPASPYSAATNAPGSGSGYPGGYQPPGYPGYPGQPGQHGQYGPGFPGQQTPWAPPPPYGSYPTPYQQGGNGKAVAGLVLGIVSIVMFWTTFFNVVFLVLALIFGILGMRDSKVRNGAGRGLALAGLICTAVGFVATAIYSVWVINLANKCGGLSNGGDPGFSQCVRDKV